MGLEKGAVTQKTVMEMSSLSGTSSEQRLKPWLFAVYSGL